MEDLGNLIKDIASGDKTALKKLIELKSGFIKSVTFNVLRDNQLSEDALNEVISKIWFNAYKIKSYKNVEGFLYTISYNAAIDIKRKNKKYCNTSDEILNSIPSKNNLENETLEKLTVHSVLTKLDDDERQVLLLNCLYGYSFYDCAKIMGISYFKARRLCLNAKKNFSQHYNNKKPD